jgi:hypothetical protein
VRGPVLTRQSSFERRGAGAWGNRGANSRAMVEDQFALRADHAACPSKLLAAGCSSGNKWLTGRPACGDLARRTMSQADGSHRASIRRKLSGLSPGVARRADGCAAAEQMVRDRHSLSDASPKKKKTREGQVFLGSNRSASGGTDDRVHRCYLSCHCTCVSCGRYCPSSASGCRLVSGCWGAFAERKPLQEKRIPKVEWEELCPGPAKMDIDAPQCSFANLIDTRLRSTNPTVITRAGQPVGPLPSILPLEPLWG